MGKTTTLRVAALLTALSCLVAFGTACSDDTGAATTTTTNNGVVNNGTNNGGTNNGPTNNQPAANRLEHNTPQSNTLAANSNLDLKVRYVKADGTPIPNATIAWQTIGETEQTALDAHTSVTQGDGVAKATLFSGTMEASFEVEASVQGDDSVSPIRFNVAVQSKEFASYKVIVNYNGVRSYTNSNVEVRLFPSNMGCADLDYHVLLNAERSEKRPQDAAGFPMNFVFPNLPNNTSYTAVATAYADGQDKVVGSWGCNDSRPVILDGNNPDDVIINMTDTIPVITGRWNVTSRFDLSQAVPDSVATYLNPILDFFTDPAGTIVTVASDYIEQQFGLDLGQFQGIVEAIVNDLLRSALNANETVSDVFVGAGDVVEILRNFQLQGQITITDANVDDLGVITQAAIQYYTFGYRWRLQCDPGEFEMDPTCGDNYISFQNANINPIVGTFDGGVVANPNYAPSQGRNWFHELAISDHPVQFNYGQIILYLIERLALPTIFGDPSIDSIRALLQRFIGNNCASLFDTQLFETVCNTVVDQVSSLATDFLTEQSFEYERFTFGTPASEGCALYEKADNEYGSPTPPARFHDPQFKQMGKEGTHPQLGDLRCKWDVKIQFSTTPGDGVELPGLWNGEKAFDN